MVSSPAAPGPVRQPHRFSIALPLRAALGVALFWAAFVLSDAAAQDYVGSGVCAECHEAEAAAWRGSHHAAAWTQPSAETVRADFDATTFALGEMTARFRVSPGGSYHVAVTEEDGVTTQYEVHSVVGVEPLQQYLLETEPGRLQSFDVVWDTEEEKWFHLYPDEDLPPDEAFHWTGPYKTWNARCAECHATGYTKAYDPATQSYASTQAEIGVGCEACHGPGSAHLSRIEGRAVAQSVADLDAFGFSQSFATTEATIQQCATCHSRREAFTDQSPVPGTAFPDSYGLALLRPGLYFADGQIQDEVYVYGSFLQSKMYAAGVSCVDCHDAHTARRIASGNAVCTQCHSPAGNPRFETLTRAEYDGPGHHFHVPGSAGAQCKACHAPERVYMGNDWRADHSFRVPRPDLAASTGAPDACTSCHTDKPPAWAADEIAERFPESRHRGPHYGQVLAHGRENPVLAAGDLATLAEDPAQPGLVRATALWLLEQANSPTTAARLAPLMGDPDPFVRAAAVALQRTAPPIDRVRGVVQALADPVRSVRMAAVATLFDAPIARLPRRIRADFAQASAEWRRSFASRFDFPETHLQLGGWALVSRNLPAAEEAFGTAVALDPQSAQAWAMRVRIAAATGGAPAARAMLEGALAVLPQDPALRALAVELR